MQNEARRFAVITGGSSGALRSEQSVAESHRKLAEPGSAKG